MFAKKSKGATSYTESNSNGFSGLLWMLFGAIITLVIGVFVYKSPIFGFNSSDSKMVQSDESTIKPKVQADKGNPDYQFYDLLPDQKSQIIPNAIVEPKVLEEKIEKKAKNLKADVVVKESKEPAVTQTSSEKVSEAQNSEANSQQVIEITDAINKDSKPVAEDGEMIIVYENTTYDNDSETTDRNTKATTGITKVISQNETSEGSKKVISDSINALTITETHAQKTTNTKMNQGPESSANIIKNAKDKGTASIKTATIKEQESKPSKSYILQIDTYDNADDADTRRAQVLLAGEDAQVSKKQVNDKIFYQVMTTQMTSPEAVVRAQQNLQKNGIGSIVVEKRIQ